MTNETFELDGIEYGIGLNEERNPYIFRLDGGLIHKQKPIIRKVVLRLFAAICLYI